MRPSPDRATRMMRLVSVDRRIQITREPDTGHRGTAQPRPLPLHLVAGPVRDPPTHPRPAPAVRVSVIPSPRGSGVVRCDRGSRWARSIKRGDHAEPARGSRVTRSGGPPLRRIKRSTRITQRQMAVDAKSPISSSRRPTWPVPSSPRPHDRPDRTLEGNVCQLFVLLDVRHIVGPQPREQRAHLRCRVRLAWCSTPDPPVSRDRTARSGRRCRTDRAPSPAGRRKESRSAPPS